MRLISWVAPIKPTQGGSEAKMWGTEKRGSDKKFRERGAVG